MKEFEIVLWKKRRIRLCLDSSPGLSIAGQFKINIIYVNYISIIITKLIPTLLGRNFIDITLFVQETYLTRGSISLGTDT